MSVKPSQNILAPLGLTLNGPWDERDARLVLRHILAYLDKLPHCPACGNPYLAQDSDPRCSSCVEAGVEPELGRYPT